MGPKRIGVAGVGWLALISLNPGRNVNIVNIWSLGEGRQG
jgi:hypothetical protein